LLLEQANPRLGQLEPQLQRIGLDGRPGRDPRAGDGQLVLGTPHPLAGDARHLPLGQYRVVIRLREEGRREACPQLSGIGPVEPRGPAQRLGEGYRRQRVVRRRSEGRRLQLEQRKQGEHQSASTGRATRAWLGSRAVRRSSSTYPTGTTNNVRTVEKKMPPTI